MVGFNFEFSQFSDLSLLWAKSDDIGCFSHIGLIDDNFDSSFDDSSYFESGWADVNTSDGDVGLFTHDGFW